MTATRPIQERGRCPATRSHPRETGSAESVAPGRHVDGRDDRGTQDVIPGRTASARGCSTVQSVNEDMNLADREQIIWAQTVYQQLAAWTPFVHG